MPCAFTCDEPLAWNIEAVQVRFLRKDDTTMAASCSCHIVPASASGALGCSSFAGAGLASTIVGLWLKWCWDFWLGSSGKSKGQGQGVGGGHHLHAGEVVSALLSEPDRQSVG